MSKKPLELLSGVGAKKAEKLKKLQLETYDDLLNHFPMRYEDRRQVKSAMEARPDESVVIEAKCIRKKVVMLSRNRKEMMVLTVRDHYIEGEILYFNPQYIKGDFQEGDSYYFYGKVEKQGAIFKMSQPDYAPSHHTHFLRIMPVYPLTLGITNKEMIRLQKMVQAQVLNEMDDLLPPMVRTMYDLIPLKEAYASIHFPEDKAAYKKARKRLVFQELFELQLRLILLKQREKIQHKAPYKMFEKYTQWFFTLPFERTVAQKKVLEDIENDVLSGRVMNRLIQGDVGSGKTIVAFSAIYLTVLNGEQGALMVPTALLAEQHYEAIQTLLGCQLRTALLTSSTKAKDKREIKEKLASGEIDVVIGTHALIENDVVFHKLGMVVTDEQHRFGIKQRVSVNQKGEMPHVLAMSATPIPRTLSLILYGDMDVSTIDVLPNGRKVIKTHFVKKDKVEDLYRFVEDAFKEGRQAYVVCPLVEDSETLDLQSATAYYETLQERFRGFEVGLVHGKMPAKEKEEVMHRFKRGDIHLLVSTTVIEVGINVPNATIMVIANTERFGLAQLHQLRGRVGRGSEQSYCFLLSDKLGQTSKERIQTLIASNDGFEIAQKDLELRGPGEVFGLRQHGLPELKLANLTADKKALEETQKCVKMILAEQKLGNKTFDVLIETLRLKNLEGFTL